MTTTNFLKNIHILEAAGLLNESKTARLQEAAKSYKQFSAIDIKIVEADEKKIVVQFAQGKSGAGHYFDKKRLVEIAHECFDPVFPGLKILPHVVPYSPPVWAVVDPGWIEKKMVKLKIGQKDLINDLRMDRSNLFNYINGKIPLTDIMKIAFYYYFSYRDLEIKLPSRS